MRNKIDYGIHLGLEYACICRMEKSVPVIKKIEVTDDFIPCCVYFNRRGGTVVGMSAYRSLKSDKKNATKLWKHGDSNAFVEFQRTMGTDTIYHSQNMENQGLKADYTSEELSAEVLKALRSYITDDSFRSVVITVPAQFTDNQKSATKQAAKLAGFEHCELLLEPIAASMAYCMSSIPGDGYWMVYDFGEGTFTVSLLKVEDNVFKILDTDRDNYLGGKDLEYAIVDEIIIPYLKEYYGVESILTDNKRKNILRDALKTYAEDIMNKLSIQNKVDIISNLGELGVDEDGEEIELDLTVTQKQAFNNMRPFFQKSIDVCKNILERNSINENQLKKIILTGGSTRYSLVRDMLRDQISKNVDTSVDPMTAFASGAAFYASTLDADVKDEAVDVRTIRFIIGYEITSEDKSEWVGIQLDKATTGADCPNKVYVKLVSSDKTWSSERTEIDANGNVVELPLKEGKVNTFSILTYDEHSVALECQPNEITITQGTKAGTASLPYYICSSCFNETFLRVETVPIKGLEKGTLLPASGKLPSLKYDEEIIPNDEGIAKIPIFEVESLYKGQYAWLCENVAEILITGECLDFVIPKETAIDIIISVDSAGQLNAKAIVPELGRSFNPIVHFVKNSPDSEYSGTIKYEIRYGYNKLDKMLKDGMEIGTLYSELKAVDNDFEIMSIGEKNTTLLKIKEVLRKIDKLDNETIFERRKINLIKGIAKAKELRDRLYTKYSFYSLSVIERDARNAFERDDPKSIRKLLSEVDSFIISQSNKIKKDEELKRNSVLLDINVFENTELHKAYANISIDKESDYQILDIRIRRMESKLSPNRWTSELIKINKTGRILELDLPTSFFDEYEITAYTESGARMPVYPSILIIDKNNNLKNYQYGKNQN